MTGNNFCGYGVYVNGLMDFISQDRQEAGRKYVELSGQHGYPNVFLKAVWR